MQTKVLKKSYHGKSCLDLFWTGLVAHGSFFSTSDGAKMPINLGDSAPYGQITVNLSDSDSPLQAATGAANRVAAACGRPQVAPTSTYAASAASAASATDAAVAAKLASAASAGQVSGQSVADLEADTVVLRNNVLEAIESTLPQLHMPGIKQVILVRMEDGIQWDIDLGKHMLGRSRFCDIQISDSAAVSRHHAQLTHTNEGVYITDQGSSNGTIVDNVRLMPFQQAALQDGSMIILGNIYFGITIRDRKTL
jgi:predicted component of type VI protein secretion system